MGTEWGRSRLSSHGQKGDGADFCPTDTRGTEKGGRSRLSSDGLSWDGRGTESTFVPAPPQTEPLAKAMFHPSLGRNSAVSLCPKPGTSEFGTEVDSVPLTSQCRVRDGLLPAEEDHPAGPVRTDRTGVGDAADELARTGRMACGQDGKCFSLGLSAWMMNRAERTAWAWNNRADAERGPSVTEKRTTLADVAALAKVSPTAVSLVLNDRPTRLSSDAVGRIRAAAEHLDYRPNPAARSLRLGKTQTVGFLSDDVTVTRYASAMIRGLLDVAEQHRHTVLIAETGSNPRRVKEALRAMLDRQPEADAVRPDGGQGLRCAEGPGGPAGGADQLDQPARSPQRAAVRVRGGASRRTDAAGGRPPRHRDARVFAGTGRQSAQLGHHPGTLRRHSRGPGVCTG